MPRRLRLLYVYRLRAGLSQECLAEAIGVPQESISMWENGLEIPPQHLQKLFEILKTAGVLPDDISPMALGEYYGTSIE